MKRAALSAAVLIAVLSVGIAPHEQSQPPLPTKPIEWLHIEKESEEFAPDSPEQVLIVLKTRDGKKWVATWEEQK